MRCITIIFTYTHAMDWLVAMWGTSAIDYHSSILMSTDRFQDPSDVGYSTKRSDAHFRCIQYSDKSEGD